MLCLRRRSIVHSHQPPQGHVLHWTQTTTHLVKNQTAWRHHRIPRHGRPLNPHSLHNFQPERSPVPSVDHEITPEYVPVGGPLVPEKLEPSGMVRISRWFSVSNATVVMLTLSASMRQTWLLP